MLKPFVLLRDELCASFVLQKTLPLSCTKGYTKVHKVYE